MTWIKDGKEIDTTKDNGYTLLSNNKLRLTGITGEMAGFYRCKAENEFGSSILGWNLELVVPCKYKICLLYTSPSPRDATLSRMPSSA